MSVDFDEIKAYYQGKLHAFGSSPKGMDWKDEETQHLRFEILSRYMNFAFTPSILDVGCGNSEFRNFCRKKGLFCVYTGLDLLPEMVELSNTRFGMGTSIQGELLSLDRNRRYDYVIASGTFNAKLSADEASWKEYLFKNVKAMSELADKAIVFNCMTKYVDYRYDRLFYARPEELADFLVSNVSRRFIIDHSYPLYEMTVAIFKE